MSAAGCRGRWGGVEEQDGELRCAAGAEVKGDSSRYQEDAVVGGDLGVGEADEALRSRGSRGRGGEAMELGEGGVGFGAVDVDVAEAFLAGGVEAAADYEGGGDDSGHRAVDGGNLCEQGGDEEGEERPDGIGRSPELLREESPVDGGEEDQGEEWGEGGIAV